MRGARGLDLGRIDPGHDDARLDIALGEDLAPGIDDQRMAIGLALVLMQAGLRGGEDEAAGLDRACTQQHVPMRFTGLAGEGRGHRDEVCAALGQRAVERGEAHVVADRQPDAAPGQVGDHGGLARLVIGGFAITLAVRQLDVEHVDLVVAREHTALGPDQEGAVDRFLL
ncbi:hypothetical protein ACVW04_000730 [Bradyrhizobium sp. LM2.3]